MIVSYGSKETERFSQGAHARSFEPIKRAGRLKLNKLKDASTPSDIASLPGNRFEKLRGDRAGQFSIRINDQWCNVFSKTMKPKGSWM